MHGRPPLRAGTQRLRAAGLPGRDVLRGQGEVVPGVRRRAVPAPRGPTSRERRPAGRRAGGGAMNGWNTAGPIVTPFSQAIEQLVPLGWLTHQWWFIVGLLVLGLALCEAADRAERG